MVIIGGTSLTQESLPLSDLIEYRVESNPSTLELLLKTMAKSTTCVKVYLHMSLKNIVLMPVVSEKTEYFNDDAELISLLQNSSDGTKVPSVDEVVEAEQQKELNDEVDVPEFNDTMPDPVQELQGVLDKTESMSEGKSTLVQNSNVNKDNTSETVHEEETVDTVSNDVSEVILPTVDTDLSDAFLSIPSCGEDTDSLKVLLDSKNEIIKQKDGMIADLKANQQELFEAQEKEIMDICKEYERKVDEANATIASLKEAVTSVTMSDEDASFLKFMNYAKNCKGALREGFTDSEKSEIGKISSKITILAAGAGDSLFSMMGYVSKLAESRDDILFVDMTNDMYLTTKYRWRSKGSIFNHLNEGVSIADIVKKDGTSSEVIPSTVFNDIALLTINWASLLKDLLQYANGKRIVFMFGNINSFCVRYTVEKLSSIGDLYVFAKASPLILTSSFSDLKFLPNNKVKLIVLDYIEVVKAIVTEINKSYAITAFSKGISWEKLGIK